MKNEEKPASSSILPLCLLAVVFAAASAFLASPYPDDEDGVNFLLGLWDYNPAFHQPHFPGYPVYIAAGKGLAFLTNSDEWGLIALSLVSTIAAGAALGRVVSSDSRWPAAALLFWANPVIFGFSHKIFTEPFALFILLISTLSAGAGTGFGWFLSGISSGVLMGIRLSWWPFAAVFGVMSWRGNFPIPYFFGFAVGVFLWIVPMIEIVGAHELYVTGRDFIAGHFMEWGGAIQPSASLVDRVVTFFTTLATVVTGMGLINEFAAGPWILFIGIGIFVSAYYSHERTEASRMFLTASLFYLLWIAAGQNVTKARHFIPLVPAVIIALAPAIRRVPPVASIAGVALAVGLSIVHVQRAHAEPPAARFHHWLDENAKPGTVVFCGPAERFFDKYFADTPVKSVKRSDILSREIRSTWPAPEHALACGDIPGLRFDTKPVAEFAARSGDPVDKTLRVYKVDRKRP